MKIVSTKKGRIIKETVTGYICIAPMLLALFVFTFYPIFQGGRRARRCVCFRHIDLLRFNFGTLIQCIIYLYYYN